MTKIPTMRMPMKPCPAVPRSLWRRLVEDVNAGRASWNAVAVDGRGSVYVVGGLSGPQGCSWAVVHKYSIIGNLVWMMISTGTGARWSVAERIVVQADGAIIVAGRVAPGPAGAAVFVRKHCPLAGTLWSRELTPHGAAQEMSLRGLATTDRGDLLLTTSGHGVLVVSKLSGQSGEPTRPRRLHPAAGWMHGGALRHLERRARRRGSDASAPDV